ncbi:hypothetical protein AeMF1_018444 [Aphanomyces euteiches]|nr:hypothetical protein AeMF1_018444 [Aphanomyces euteiches]
MTVSTASVKSGLPADLALLAFDGKKAAFRVWSQGYISYLEGLTLEMLGNYLREPKKLPEPRIKYEDWLTGVPPVVSTGNEAHDQWHAYNRKRTEQKVRFYLYQLLPKSFVQQLRDTTDSKTPVHEVWSEVNRRYVKTAQKPFDNIQSWFGEMKSLKNLINAQSQQHLGRDSVTDDMLIYLALNELPSQFYGAQIKYDASFTLSEVETKLVGVFGQKKKSAILTMGGQNPKQEIPVNNVTKLANQNAGKRKSSSGPANQSKHADTGNGKGYQRPSPQSVVCFYCTGKYNVDGKDHPKWKCPKRADDFACGIQDATPRCRDAKQEEIPCGAITTQREVNIPDTGSVGAEVVIPDADEGTSIEEILFNDDDEMGDNIMQFSPALSVDTTTTPRMENVAASMKTLSVELDKENE